MTEAHESKDKSTRITAYTDVCRRISPVFHNFFFENFHSPVEWFNRRLTYTRSCAASSIVGESHFGWHKHPPLFLPQGIGRS
jgi:phosphatidylinositol kinase/protein kinase (PI-3  family)